MSIFRQKGDETWNSISIYQYNQIRAVVEDDSVSYEDKVMELIEIVFNINPYKIPYNDFGGYMAGLEFIKNPVPEVSVRDTYILDGTAYKLVTDISKINVAQYIDYSKYIQDDPTVDNYSSILSVFLIPEGLEYNDGYDIMKAKRDIDQYLSIVDASAISSFFLAFYQRFIKIFLRYLKVMMKRMKKMTKEERAQLKEQIRVLEEATGYSLC